MPKLPLCRATSKGLFSVLESSRRVAQKSSSETRTHGSICKPTLEYNAFQKTDAWIIPETTHPAPHALVAPVNEEIGRAEQPVLLLRHWKLQRHRGQKRLKAHGSSEKPVTLQQTGRARDSSDNHSLKENSRVAAMLKTCETS